jgi:hypothetical protein
MLNSDKQLHIVQHFNTFPDMQSVLKKVDQRSNAGSVMSILLRLFLTFSPLLPKITLNAYSVLFGYKNSM